MWALGIGASVAISVGLLAPPAGATHAYRCDVSDDPAVRRAACIPHQAWDAVTRGRPGGVVCAIGDLGVDNVKDCEADQSREPLGGPL